MAYRKRYGRRSFGRKKSGRRTKRKKFTTIGRGGYRM